MVIKLYVSIFASAESAGRFRIYIYIRKIVCYGKLKDLFYFFFIITR